MLIKFKSVGHLMLPLSFTILYLYISYVHGSTFSGAHDIRPSSNQSTWISTASTLRGAKWISSSLANNHNNIRVSNRSLHSIYSQIDSNNLGDILNKSQEISNSNNSELYQDVVLPTRSDNSMNSIDSVLSNNSQTSLLIAYSDSKNDSDHELDKAELHTNNHQSSSGGPGSSLSNQNSHNTRHYNSYQVGSPMSAHYNKYTSSHPHGTSSFANNLNLNYIHNLLLAKPTSSSSLSNLLNFNSNNLALTASPYGLSLQNGYVSSYYSSPSATNNVQQVLSATKDLQPADSLFQPQTNSESNMTIGSTDFNLSTSCGKQQVGAREPRIVGGNSTYEGEFPWAVSIQRQGNHHCGGVIVGKRWILTAAHCVRSQLVGNLIVRTGGHTLTRLSNHITSHLGRDYLVEQIVMHDDFSRYDNLTASQLKSSANTNNADIALLKLKHDIYWNDLAWPVCFPNREAGNFSGHDAVVIGWGKLNEKSEDFSNELQKVKLTIIDNKVCHNWFRQAGRDMPIDDRIICAGFKNGGKDACHGDSGGPLLSKINGHYVVVGVVSTGIGCARPLLPGLYSRVSSYIGWIERYVTS